MSSGIHVNGKLCVTMTNNLHDEDYSSTELWANCQSKATNQVSKYPGKYVILGD